MTAAAAAAKRQPLLPLDANALSPSPLPAEPAVAAGAAAEKENLLAHARRPLKSSSLQLRMKVADAESQPSAGGDGVWEFSESESAAAPASSWFTLPNRVLLCRSLPVEVGRCTCVLAAEPATTARRRTLYSLYTNEGPGREDRKLAVAWHRRRRGRSEFLVAQNEEGIVNTSEGSFLGLVSANLVGTKYRVFGQGNPLDESVNGSKPLLCVVEFTPTITTLFGSFRSIRAWVPNHESTNLKHLNLAQIRHVSEFPADWQDGDGSAEQLSSRTPLYNPVMKRYELDFRERAGKMGHRVQASVKNFQMKIGETGRQTILQLGRVGKSKYIMEFRHPLTGYQAFCICLAAIDSKLCCSI